MSKPTIKSLLESARWYQRTRERLIADYGADANLMADLIAATSPQRATEVNIQLAKEVYREYCLFGSWESVVGLLPNHKTNIRRALNREPLRGLKVRAFAENLKGNLDVVTIDTIIWGYYRPGVWITAKRHKKLCRYIKSAAKRRGLKPAEYQAIIWVKARGNRNAVLSMFDGV
jgi:soluble lytic murein transglycosylase-like protein